MKSIICIPTYNEASTVIDLLLDLEQIQNEFQFDVLVIDDNSPDGTADIVDKLGYPWVKVMRRKGKLGLGVAYRAAFAQILTSDTYTHVVSMDADGSHRVKDLSTMFNSIPATELSITLGTRWMPGGSVVNWPIHRRFLSRAGTSYARNALQIPLRDLTGGFRIYSISLLRKLNLNNMRANGYCFQIEMALASDLAGATAVEVPITFVERINGQSKMSKGIVAEALWQITRWGLIRALRPNADKIHYVKSK